MPGVPPEVIQWIRQMGSIDQAVAFYAYQSLQEHVLRASAPGEDERQRQLVAALGAAMTAPAKSKEGGAQPASFGNNPFLSAVASQRVTYEHPAAVRSRIARLLGFLPRAEAVSHLAKALDDLEAREMARCSLEGNSSEAALDTLIAAVRADGTTFRVGVLNSLGKRKARRAAAALRESAADPHPEVRMAAVSALAELGDASQDEVFERATRSENAEERRAAHVARVRLAARLQAEGDGQSAARIYNAVVASDAAEPQKKAARLALGAV